MTPVILCGAGGHGRVLLDALRASGRPVAGVCGPGPAAPPDGLPWLGDDAWLERQDPAQFDLVNAIGSTGDPGRRIELFTRFKAAGFTFATVIHPSAIVGSAVTVGEGAQLMAGVIVQTGSVLGANVIVNTRASVDHDCVIGDHVHLAPGVVLSGGVTVGARTHIGTGAVAIQGVRVGAGCLVGAGSLLLGALPDGVRAHGVPARRVSLSLRILMTSHWKSTLLSPDDSLRRTIECIDASSLQIGLVVDAGGRLLGTVTDGDVRRAILRGTKLEAPVSGVMNPRPTVGQQGESLARRRALLRARDLRQLPIVDAAGRLVGLETLATIERRRDNWVVLMAGGKGTRLRPLTDDRPKPLLEVGDRPILETILERLVSHGFGRFFISVNYMAHMIEEHFGDGSRWGVQIEYLREREQLGTAGALQLLPEAPTEPVLIMNGDLLTSIDFGQLLGFHESRRPWATMCVREYDFQVPYGVVRIDGHQLVGFDEKPVHRFFVNAGIYVLSPEAIALVPPGRPCDMPTLFQEVTSRGQPASVFPVREYWMDIGQLEDFKRAQRDFDGIFGPGAKP